MLNYICSMIMVVALLANGEIYAVVKKAVDAVNETTPAKTWDGQYLKSVRLIERTKWWSSLFKMLVGKSPRLMR